MSGSLLQILLENWWSIPVGIFCLSFSIFIHELGHFLAARWRGVWVPRFSFFGLGKPIFGWKWRGVEWCVCWIPIGAHVLIPQLADLGDAEGGSVEIPPEKMAPLTYFDKVVIAAAGAAFNIILALLVGTVLWCAGETVSAGSQTTRIGYVYDTVRTSDGKFLPGPAKSAGLQAGDMIRSIDGVPMKDWDDIVEGLLLGDGKLADGRRKAEFGIERDGKTLAIAVYPVLATKERIRMVGIASSSNLWIAEVDAKKLGGKFAGLAVGDQLVSINGVPLTSRAQLEEALTHSESLDFSMEFRRGEQLIPVTIPAGALGKDGTEFGLKFRQDTTILRTPPHQQILAQIKKAFRMIRSLVSSGSDIGASKMGGPVALMTAFANVSLGGFLKVLSMVVAVNVSLAVLNLLPIPVLDGGHILFATIAKIRGKALPASFVQPIQAAFFFAMIGLMLYIFPHDIWRVARPLEDSPLSSSPAPAKQGDTAPVRTSGEPPAKP